MPKKVLIITTSLRTKSNSDVLANSFAAGARKAGHTVELISLKEKQIAFCRGCLVCQQTHRCVIQDDAIAIAEKIRTADVVVFATPVYYYGLSGQLKTLLDRCNSVYGSPYTFRDVYLLASAAEADPSTADGSIRGIQGWLDCFEEAQLAGHVFAGDVPEAGQIEGRPVLEQAFVLGSSL